MAAVTVSRIRRIVNGNRREILATITVVTTGDTWVTGLKRIEHISSNTPAELTKIAASGGTATFTGTAAGAMVRVVGY